MAHLNTERSGSQQGEPIEETIRFNESEDQDGFLIREESTLVNIFPSLSGQKLSTSKLKIRNLVDYGWEPVDGCGRLISTHLSGKYIAYVIKVANVGAVRVFDLHTNERALLKGTKGLIKDVEFLHKMDALIVAFIDEYGSFYIYRIVKDAVSNKLQTHLVLNVELEGAPCRLEVRRFVWCKYVPDEDSEIETVSDCAYHFAVLQNNMVYVSNLIQLVQKFGEGKHSLSELNGYYMTIDSHADSVYDASFAPDGTALATACKDGTVNFFQVYIISEDSPRCLYSWTPHDGLPVSRLLFLDDHSLKSAADCQYWKYMITAGPSQNEIMLWTCKSWKCLQTLKFNSAIPSSQMRIEMDLGANFLIVSDLKRKVMFVFRLENDDDSARFVWVNEFSLPTSLLSFNVSEGLLLPFEDVLATHEANQLEEFVRSGENHKDHLLCLIGLYFIQVKSLQYGKVIFVPPTTSSEVNSLSPTLNRISFDPSLSLSFDEGCVEPSLTQTPPHPQVPELEGQSLASFFQTKSTMNIGAEGPSRSASRSASASRSPSRSRSPHSCPDDARAQARSHSPKNTSSNVSAQMSQQLSNLFGLSGSLGVGADTSTGPGNNDMSRTPDMIQLKTPSPPSPFSGGHSNNENVVMQGVGDIRPRTTSMNGNGSNASSSPSREVEEILSPKNTTDLIGRRSQTQTAQSMEGQGLLNNLDVQGNIIGVQEDNLPLKSMNMNMNSHSTPKQNSLPIVPDLTLTSRLPQVLDQVVSLMETQANEIKELKREVSRMNAVQAMSQQQQMDQKAFVRVLDKYFASNQVQMRRIEDSISAAQSQEKQRMSQTQLVAPNLPEILGEKLGRILKSEIEVCVLPNVMKMFEPTKTHLKNETLKLIQSAENRIKEDLREAMSGHNFHKMLAPGIEESMSGVLEGVVSNQFRSTIIPNFEKSLQSLFAKINDTFMRGTKEYMNGLEATVGMRRSQPDTSQNDLIQQFSTLQDSLSSSLQVELETQLQSGMRSLQVGLLKHLEDTMTRELNKGFMEQQRYMEVSVVPRTANATPAVSMTEQRTATPSRPPPMDLPTMRKHVFNLLEIGEVTPAFVQATRFGDGPTVLELAEKIHPSKVFTTSLPPQTVMSLIQLFVTDLHNCTQTKLQYLHTALGSLNLSQDKKVAASLARIIPIFQLSAKTFMATHPDNPHLPNLKILEMAFIGLARHSNLSALSPQ